MAARGCRVLLLDEPTRGVDVGARSRDLRAGPPAGRRRASACVVSSEVPEVLGLADRVLVMRRGPRRPRGTGAELDEHRVLDLVMEGSAA